MSWSLWDSPHPRQTVVSGWESVETTTSTYWYTCGQLAHSLQESTSYNWYVTGTGKAQTERKGTHNIPSGMQFLLWWNQPLCFGPQKYIKQTAAWYYYNKTMFGEKPNLWVTSALEKNNHLELDTTKLLDINGIKQYQLLIDILLWVITLGHFEIATTVMTISGFWVVQWVGHLEWLKRIVGYLVKIKHTFIRICTEEPDYSGVTNAEYYWSAMLCRWRHQGRTGQGSSRSSLGKPILFTS